MFFTVLAGGVAANATAFAHNATLGGAGGNATLSTEATATLPTAANATLSTAANATLAIESMAGGSVPPPVVFSWFGYFEAIAVMFFLLGVLWALLWLVRRYGKFRFLPAPGNFPTNGLRIEAQLPLGPRRGLYVIHYLGERLLIGVTEQQITLLQEGLWPDPAAAPEPSNPRTDFVPDHPDHPDHPDAQRFARVLQQERDAAPEPSHESQSLSERHGK